MLRIHCTLVVLIAISLASLPESHARGGAPSPATSPASPALQWKKGAPSPFARVEAPTAVVDGKMYLFGGFVKGLGASNEVDVYDPATDAWIKAHGALPPF